MRRILAVVFCLVSVAGAPAYVDLAPTLGRIVRESQTITVVEVDRFAREKGVVVLKKVKDLKGESPDGTIKHELVRQNETAVDRVIHEWAEPGRRAVIFSTG